MLAVSPCRLTRRLGKLTRGEGPESYPHDMCNNSNRNPGHYFGARAPVCPAERDFFKQRCAALRANKGAFLKWKPKMQLRFLACLSAGMAPWLVELRMRT